MSTQTKISAAFAAVTTKLNALHTRIGLLSGLGTTDKTSIVAAINEVKSATTGFASINDTATSATEVWSSSKTNTQIANAISAVISGADAANDTLLELASRITANAAADAGAVSVASVQSFSAPQKLQACTNIGIGDPEYDYAADFSSAIAF